MRKYEVAVERRKGDTANQFDGIRRSDDTRHKRLQIFDFFVKRWCHNQGTMKLRVEASFETARASVTDPAGSPF